MTADTRALRHGDVVNELKLLRERGLGAVRKLRLDALHEATELSGLARPNDRSPAAIADLVRKAVKHLDGGDYQAAAEYTFGLTGGTKMSPAVARRRMAAGVFGLATETFRKKHEKEIVDDVAEGVLALCHDQAMRVAHLGMQQRHPADTRLAVAWVERFEAYYRIWTPVYALKADLEAALATYKKEPSEHLPWDPDSVDAFDPIKEAQGYARSALYWYAGFLLAEKQFIDERGGMWLFSDPKVEEVVTDAVYRIGWHNPINEENDSWLRRKLADSRHQEAEPFYRAIEASTMGENIHIIWQQFVVDGHTAEVADDLSASQVHRTIAACRDYQEAIDRDWLKIADWYAPGAKPAIGTSGRDLFKTLTKK
jgi:hypothetical protein